MLDARRPFTACLLLTRRSCRERLLLHNSRRKQRVEARAESDSDDQTAQHPAPGEPQGFVAAELPAGPSRGAGWAYTEPILQPRAAEAAEASAHPLAMAPPPRRARNNKPRPATGSNTLTEEQVRGVGMSAHCRSHHCMPTCASASEPVMTRGTLQNRRARPQCWPHGRPARPAARRRSGWAAPSCRATTGPTRRCAASPPATSTCRRSPRCGPAMTR